MRSRLCLSLALGLAGCMVGPDYRRPPAIGVSAAFKEAPGWTAAQPSDATPKGNWWSIYHDALLDQLEPRVAVSNQNVRQIEAQLREAQATVDASRAALFPTVSGSVSDTRSLRSPGSIGLSTTSTGVAGSAATLGGGSTTTQYTLDAGVNWDLDVWGRIRRQVQSDVAAAQVSASDLANATLSAQATLATDYFELRAQDALQTLLTQTVGAYGQTLRITRNQYGAGTTDASTLAQAQAQLDSARASLANVGLLRDQYEHAIAVLTGRAPAELGIAGGTLAADVPVAPGVVPSLLLQRRPDIAAAERGMAQQNALIGVQVAAFYPDISLSALYGFSGNPLGSLIQASNRVWSLGANATQTLFEGGLRNAQVAAARAAYEASVAGYRQTVLSAFQQVEDELSALRILGQQAAAAQTAVSSSRHAVEVTLNTYLAGTTTYTAVVTQQTTLLADQETALAVQEQRMVASVTLVQALGGGWSTQDLPSREALQSGLPFLKY